MSDPISELRRSEFRLRCRQNSKTFVRSLPVFIILIYVLYLCGELFKRDDADITYKRQFVGETDILAEKRKATDGRIRKVG